MNTLPTPKTSRAPAFPLVWVVPIIAAAIGGWMAFRELHHRGPLVTIDFSDGSAVEAGRTILEYKGVAAGTVETVELKPGLGGVTIRLRLNKNAAVLASTGAQFWIVHPEIGFAGVRGLDTLVTGVRLNVRPGAGPPALQFTGLDKTPAPEITDQGRAFILQSDRLGSLTIGAPVFYRAFKVGQVEASRLSEDSTAVLTRIHVAAPYVGLVRTNSKFWNTGGFSLNLSLFGGASSQGNSLESLITGGVAFATPDSPTLAAEAPRDAQFALAAEPDKDWLKWAPKIPIKSPDAAAESQSKSGILNEFIQP